MFIKLNGFDFEIVKVRKDYKVTVDSVASIAKDWDIDQVKHLFEVVELGVSKSTKRGMKKLGVLDYSDAVEVLNLLGEDYIPKFEFHAKDFAKEICSTKAIAIQVGCDEELAMMLCFLYKKALGEIEKPPHEYIKMVVDKLMTKIDALPLFKEILRVTWRNSSDWYDNPHSVIKKALQSL